MSFLSRPLILVLLICLSNSTCCQPILFAQQSNTVPTVEAEFFEAIKKGDAQRVVLLINQKPELLTVNTKNGTTAVLFAVFTNHKDIAELLLARGIQPNIFEAAATGRTDLVRELLTQDPQSAKASSADGWTALHLNWGNPRIAELLLKSGADIEAVSKNRFMATPLQSAVAAKWSEVARFLISHGANVNCRGDAGFSPLHEAASSGQLEIARLLLDHGAKTDARTEDGKTPLAIAMEFKQQAIVSLLHGRKVTQ
ncbi:MAG TPA: ankyrin repeat domain-containing protein [Pyrinomonadaceae bacterium]|nr:ankyrin repeat domain-containing protein [Pyrinomonadaceae bacterium]